MSSKIIKLKRNQPVYQEGDQANCVYFILEGEFMIFKSSQQCTDRASMARRKKVDKVDWQKLQWSKEQWHRFIKKEEANQISNNRKIKARFTESVGVQNQKVPLEVFGIHQSSYWFSRKDISLGTRIQCRIKKGYSM